MNRALSRAEIRAVDQRAWDEYGLSGLVLMENAGGGAARFLEAQGIRGRVVICCGKGNNAGDGFVIARHLESRGHAVEVLLAVSAPRLTGDAAVNSAILQRAGTPCRDLSTADTTAWHTSLNDADWIVDALLGTGLQGTVREPFATAIEAINNAGCKVLAIDLPSGLECDTGQPLGTAVRARETVTFVARKQGFDNPKSAEYTGRVTVIDIGVPRRLLQDTFDQSDNVIP